MHIVTCFKVVPEEQDIVVTPDSKLNFDRAEAKISQFDLNGIEAGVVLAADGDTVTALSVGGKYLENTKLRKDVLSRGPSELVLVKDAAFEGALPDVTASAIAAAVKTTGFDLPSSAKARATFTPSRWVSSPPVSSAFPASMR